MTSQFDDKARRRIRWLTRRGLLELDMILERFISQYFDKLSDAELANLSKMLDLPDPEFLALINGQKPCIHTEFLPVLEKIRISANGKII